MMIVSKIYVHNIIIVLKWDAVPHMMASLRKNDAIYLARASFDF